MMTDAKLVLLDEPAAGVNRTLLRKLETKIEILNKERGYTFILIEHDMEMIEKALRTGRLHGGGPGADRG